MEQKKKTQTTEKNTAIVSVEKITQTGKEELLMVGGNDILELQEKYCQENEKGQRLCDQCDMPDHLRIFCDGEKQ